jgi:ATP-dependent Clp protease ATP-binding subunit ClpA
MIERMVREARAVVADAVEEARVLGSPTVEAEHLLLALSRDSGVAGEVLAHAGLDHATVLDALETEFERSLEAVGVSAGAFDLPAGTVPTARRPRWGTSAKSSMQRVVEVAPDRGDRRIESAHVLPAVLGAQEGTVPRALRCAGADPEALAAETRAALDRA